MHTMIPFWPQTYPKFQGLKKKSGEIFLWEASWIRLSGELNEAKSEHQSESKRDSLHAKAQTQKQAGCMQEEEQKSLEEPERLWRLLAWRVIKKPGWNKQIELTAEEVGSGRRWSQILVRATSILFLWPWGKRVASLALISSLNMWRGEVVSPGKPPNWQNNRVSSWLNAKQVILVILSTLPPTSISNLFPKPGDFSYYMSLEFIPFSMSSLPLLLSKLSLYLLWTLPEPSNWSPISTLTSQSNCFHNKHFCFFSKYNSDYVIPPFQNGFLPTCLTIKMKVLIVVDEAFNI